jgi:hypothetical protein
MARDQQFAGAPHSRAEAVSASAGARPRASNPRNLKAAGRQGRLAQQSEASRFAANIMSLIRSTRAAGTNGMVGIAAALNDRGVRTACGARRHCSSVRNVIARNAG